MAAQDTSRFGRILTLVVIFLLLFITGLALTRLLYEGLFPRVLWLASLLPVIFLASLLGGAGILLQQNYRRRPGILFGKEKDAPFILLPLLLNLIPLLDPAVNLLRSRFFFAASLWLTAVFLARHLASKRAWPWLGALFILTSLGLVYWLTIPQVVGRADTFEFQVVIPQLGIAHPTGYPLYLLLGKLFTFFPWGSIAWRVNLASAFFAMLATYFIYLAGLKLLNRPVPALLAAVLLGLTPTFWSQAIEAEVYALHALIVSVVLWLLTVWVMGQREAGDCHAEFLSKPIAIPWQRLVVILAFVLGLGLANHLTTLFLLPPVVIAVFFAGWLCLRGQDWRDNLRLGFMAAAAFFIPLLLYLYLPIRWAALHGEPMGLSRFGTWVIGARFQGALQLSAWLTDFTRYEVVGRLLLANWGVINLLIIAIGLIFLAVKNWRMALILLFTWLGFTFYALNYYVPDLAVFIIPAHIVMAIFWGSGLAGVLAIAGWGLNRWQRPGWETPLTSSLLFVLLLPSLLLPVNNWPNRGDLSREKLLAWGEGVLAQPLATGAAILADSEKIAPLYYLQQAEGMRPDLEIMVLPDEAAYRAALDTRLAEGQTVYLARFLPGLEGVYHLRSAGPLIEVSNQPLKVLPEGVSAVNLNFAPLDLLGLSVEEPAAVDPSATAVTLYWQAGEPMDQPLQVYLRWSSPDFAGPPDSPTGSHPAGNYYPTVAWEPGEIVPDFHLLPRPVSSTTQELELQAALAPAFTAGDDLAWQTISRVMVEPVQDIELARPLRAQNGRVLLDGAQFPSEIRPGTPLPILVSGYAASKPELSFHLSPVGGTLDLTEPPNSQPQAATPYQPIVFGSEIDTGVPNGRYWVVSADPQRGAICGWLARPTAGCVLGEVVVSGVPLPAGATNFEDRIALLAVDIPDPALLPGGQLPVNLRWQSLAPMSEDYTVFLQLLDAQDRIVGQVDAWPRQGTYPTSQWTPGEIIEDPYLVQLANDLPPGNYRLQVGFYLLGTLRRLPVLDENGSAIDDKVTLSGFTVP